MIKYMYLCINGRSNIIFSDYRRLLNTNKQLLKKYELVLFIPMFNSLAQNTNISVPDLTNFILCGLA